MNVIWLPTSVHLHTCRMHYDGVVSWGKGDGVGEGDGEGAGD